MELIDTFDPELQNLLNIARTYASRNEPLPVDLTTRLLGKGVDVSGLDLHA